MTAAIIHQNMRSAMRQRLLAFVKAQTGTLTDVAVSGGNFVRASGSFLTDGFGPGDYVTVAGFATGANNGKTFITSVSALTMDVEATLTNEVSGASVSIKADIVDVAYEAVAYTPTDGVPYISESFRPASSIQRAIGPNGLIEHVISTTYTVYFPSGRGTLGVESYGGGLLEHFKPGTNLSYGGSNATISRAERAPLVVAAQWVSCPVTISLVGYTS